MLKNKIFITALAIFLIGSLGIIIWIQQMRPEKLSLLTPSVYVDGWEYSSNFISTTNDGIHISCQMLRDIANMEIYWDVSDKIVVYTNPKQVVYIGLDSSFDQDIKWIGSMPFLPLHSVELLYDGKITWYSDSQCLHVIRPAFQSYQTKLVKNEWLKAYPFSKADFYQKIFKDQSVMVLKVQNDWVKISTNQGIVGWVEKISLDTDLHPPHYALPEKPKKAETVSSKICMTWHYVYRTMSDPEEFYVAEELDVLSPTWLSLANEQGDLVDKGRKDYIDWANKHQYQVWIGCTNSFDPDLTHAVLESTKKRKTLIDALLLKVEYYGASGLNIDWENIHLADKDLFTQFIRELYPIFHQNNLLVSIDITTISESENWSLCYDREKLGKVTDYIVLMAYDQYWAGGGESGSVAEYDWVQKGVEELIELVPADKVILGVPFYSRLWIEDHSTIPITAESESYYMEYAMELGDTYSAKWDSSIRQYYAQWERYPYTYKLWIEEPKSVLHKVQLVHKYNLAGVAFWRKGYEKTEIWPLVREVLDNPSQNINELSW